MKIVIVEWEDSFSVAGWHDREEMKEQNPSKCVSVGVLLNETSEKLVVCPNLSHFNVADIMSIPKKCVTKLRQLKIRGNDD